MGLDIRENQIKQERYRMEMTMNLFCEALKAGMASGSPTGNYIKQLKVIERKDAKDLLGNPLRDCLVVRPVWSDGRERTDGYYDIVIEGDSPWGAILDVVERLRKIF